MQARLAGDAASKQKSMTSWLGPSALRDVEAVRIFCKLFPAAL